jgi:SAM-dependent methyltransferase
MPSSNKEGKAVIREWVTEVGPYVKTVLDLGVGNGTYHRLYTRKSSALREAHWTGIEVWEPYIHEFDLLTRYNKIINEDIRTVDFNTLGKIDLVFAGDVLEHITKEEAIKVVDDLLKVAKRIIVSIPIVHFPQGEEEGNPYEAHVKDDWSDAEMFETFPQIKRSWTGNTIGVYLLEL